MPYSLKGLANIVLTARLTSEQRDRISAERETKTIAMFFTFVGGSYNWIGKKDREQMACVRIFVPVELRHAGIERGGDIIPESMGVLLRNLNNAS